MWQIMHRVHLQYMTEFKSVFITKIFRPISNIFVNYTQLTYILEFIHTLYAQNDKENCGDFYNSVCPGVAKMCLGFVSFRAPPAAMKQKN